jgi:hypothetical protein
MQRRPPIEGHLPEEDRRGFTRERIDGGTLEGPQGLERERAKRLTGLRPREREGSTREGEGYLDRIKPPLEGAKETPGGIHC